MTGHLVGGFGDRGRAAPRSGSLADSANHAALIAKLIALGFGVMAATEYGAAHFLRRRIRTLFIPIACGLTVVGELRVLDLDGPLQRARRDHHRVRRVRHLGVVEAAGYFVSTR